MYRVQSCIDLESIEFERAEDYYSQQFIAHWLTFEIFCLVAAHSLPPYHATHKSYLIQIYHSILYKKAAHITWLKFVRLDNQ